MKTLFRTAAITGMLLLAALPAAAQQSGQAGTAANLQDLSGFWINQYTPNLAQAFRAELPFSAYGAERWRTVDTAKDPTGVCLPPGPSRAFTAPFPFILIQQKDMIGFLYEYQTIWRVIFMDGRGHPADIAEYPHFMGDSIGKWEGNALVVDTIGIDERSWLDTAGHEHSDKLHLTERFEKIDDNHIKYTVVYDDPVFFTKPWSLERTFTRGETKDRILPYTCTDNNKDVEHLEKTQPNLDYKFPGEQK